MGLSSFFNELKRRNVLKAALAYVIFSWVTIQAASILFSIFNVSQFWLQLLVLGLIVGLGIWLLLVWYVEIGPHGIRYIRPVVEDAPETAKKRTLANTLYIWGFTSIFLIISLILYVQLSQDTRATPEAQTPLTKLPPEKSVAVLAFLDLSPNRDIEYFSDGISEEILTYLSKNPELRVISRTSSFAFKGKDTDIRSIGHQLNANYILEGSVRRADSNLRITVQLIRAEDGLHLWSETYQRNMTEVFAIQDEIAKEVTHKLQASIFGYKMEETQPEAYTKYLQAKSLHLRYNKESAEAGLALIDQCLSIDSTYAPAWLLKSKLHFQIRVYTNAATALTHSQEAVEKAVTLNPQYGEAYAWLGRFYVINSNFTAAYINFNKALSLTPTSSEVLRQVSSYPTISLEDRILLLQRAKIIDPLDAGNHRMLSIYYFFQGNFEAALEALDTYLIYQPYGNGDHGLRGEFLAWLGCLDEALEEVRKEEDDFAKNYSELMTSLVLNLDGAVEKVEAHAHRYMEDQPYLLAQMYAYLNDTEKAYTILEKALHSNDYDLYFQLENDPYMLHLKDEARFKALLSKMKVPKALELHLSP